jgi:hypothetical protein
MKPDNLAEDVPLPDAAVTLPAEFEVLFEEPSGLPPQRSFDHAIPLMPGTRPVNLRPYRYNPAQKDETEKQIK